MKNISRLSFSKRKSVGTHAYFYYTSEFGVRCYIGCAPVTRKRSLRQDSGWSLRITAEIPFGSLAVDNKVLQLARSDSPSTTAPLNCASVPVHSVYLHASPPSRSFVLVYPALRRENHGRVP